MRSRTILTLVLAMFILAALLTVAMQTRRSAPANDRPAAVNATLPAASAQSPTTVTDGVNAAPVSAAAAVVATPRVRREPNATASSAVSRPIPPAHVRKVVATYFHGNVRCVTCRKIEAYAHEAVQDAFDGQIAAGTVEFRAVNVEEDTNRHFIQDYQLVTRTLVVTEEVDGAVTRWTKLDDVWTLVSDRTAFFRYVQGGVREYVEMQ